jgi:hypothetical protein
VSAASEWRAFLHAWRCIHDGRPVTANELCRRAALDSRAWAGTFPHTSRGELPSAKSLGRILTARTDQPAGGLVLRSVRDTHTKTRVYWIERSGQPRQVNRLAGADSTWHPGTAGVVPDWLTGARLAAASSTAGLFSEQASAPTEHVGAAGLGPTMRSRTSPVRAARLDSGVDPQTTGSTSGTTADSGATDTGDGGATGMSRSVADPVPPAPAGGGALGAPNGQMAEVSGQATTVTEPVPDTGTHRAAGSALDVAAPAPANTTRWA